MTMTSCWTMKKRKWCISSGLTTTFTLTLTLVIFVSVILGRVSSTPGEFSLIISHWNNIHGHFYPQGAESSDGGGGSGLAGLVTGLNQNELDDFIPSKFKNSNHIRLSPGDFLGAENGWLSFFTFLPAKEEMIKANFFQLLKKLHGSHLNPTAVSATWSDLRFGLDMVSKTVGGTPPSKRHYFTEPPTLLLSNVDHPLPYEPRIWDTWRIHSVKDEDGREGLIGILGFLTPSPQPTQLNRAIHIKNVIESLQNVVESAAENESSLEILFFIAVGDCDRQLCEEILDAVPQIRVVISGGSLGFEKGGHIIHKNGGIIASAGGVGPEGGISNLGMIKLKLDSVTRKFTSVNASLLFNTFAPDPPTQDTLDALVDLVYHNNSTGRKVLGRVEFPINCKKQSILQENNQSFSFCPVGNIVADALSRCVDRTELFTPHHNPHIQSHAPVIAVWHSDGLTNQDLKISAFEDIRELDVHAWMPFLDSAKLFRISGHDLGQLFTIHQTNLYVSEHLRVHFEGRILEGIYHSGGTGRERVREDEELLVLIPSFLNFSNTSHTHSYSTKPINVLCVTSMIRETRTLTWGGSARAFVSMPKNKTSEEQVQEEDHSENWLFASLLAFGSVFTVLLLIGLLFLVIRRQRRRGHLSRWRNRVPTMQEEGSPSSSRGSRNSRTTTSIWPLLDIQRERRRRIRGRSTDIELQPFILRE